MSLLVVDEDALNDYIMLYENTSGYAMGDAGRFAY